MTASNKYCSWSRAFWSLLLVLSIFWFLGPFNVWSSNPIEWIISPRRKRKYSGNVDSVVLNTRDNLVQAHRVNSMRTTPRREPPIQILATKIATFKHDHSDFTQGLEIGPDGKLWQSVGLYGKSKLQWFENYDAIKGESLSLDDKLFGEGITIVNRKLYLLTWKSRLVLVYNLDDIKSPPRTMRIPSNIREGWGLTHTSGSHPRLVLSDGTSNLFWINPADFSIEKTVEVRLWSSKRKFQKLSRLNELELDEVTGLLYANVWFDKSIYVIHPLTGDVAGVIDCSHLFSPLLHRQRDAVLNGIALTVDRTLLVTGKLWGELHEIELPNVFK